MAPFDRSHTSSYWRSIVKIWFYLVSFPRYSEIVVDSRHFSYHTCIWRPIKGSLPDYRHKVWYRKSLMMRLPGGWKSLRIRLRVSTQYTNVTDTQPANHTRHRTTAWSHSCIASRSKNWCWFIFWQPKGRVAYRHTLKYSHNKSASGTEKQRDVE